MITSALPTSTADESALTGEALPAERRIGDSVRSGVLNAGGPFDLRAVTGAADSTYAGIIRLVHLRSREDAGAVCPARRPVPAVVSAADPRRGRGGLGAGWPGASCRGPGRGYALSAHAGGASGTGLGPFRGGAPRSGREERRRTRTPRPVHDTVAGQDRDPDRRQPAVTAIVSAGSRPAGEILRLAACLDQVSGHVLAGAVVRAAAERKCQLVLPRNVAEEPGQGIAGTVDGHHVTLGRPNGPA